MYSESKKASGAIRSKNMAVQQADEQNGPEGGKLESLHEFSSEPVSSNTLARAKLIAKQTLDRGTINYAVCDVWQLLLICVSE